jgi:hypothetical protein
MLLGCGQAGNGDDLVCDGAVSAPRVTASTPAARADVEVIMARAVGGCHAVARRAGGLALPLVDGAWVNALVNRRSQQKPGGAPR